MLAFKLSHLVLKQLHWAGRQDCPHLMGKLRLREAEASHPQIQGSLHSSTSLCSGARHGGAAQQRGETHTPVSSTMK
jgi:hypothetical protein